MAARAAPAPDRWIPAPGSTPADRQSGCSRRSRRCRRRSTPPRYAPGARWRWRRWARAREEIDAINVYPVADGDTGTNLYLTVESAPRAVEAVFAARGEPRGDAGPATGRRGAGAWPHGALIGARGNSGTILAQLLRGMAQVLGATRRRRGHADARGRCARALRRARRGRVRQAVAHPVEGTDPHGRRGRRRRGRAADRRRLRRRWPAPRTSGAARRAGRDPRAAGRPGARRGRGRGRARPGDRAGGAGRGAVRASAPGGCRRCGHATRRRPARGRVPARRCRRTGVRRTTPATGGPAFEVIYLLEAEDAAVARCATRLDGLGDSLVVVGGDGLWNVHVHVDDAGAAVEAGSRPGARTGSASPTSALGDARTAAPGGEPRGSAGAARAVVAVVPGEGLAGLCAEAGATTVLARPGEPPGQRRAGRGRSGGPTRARSCCCPTTPSCATPPRRRRAGPRRGRPGRAHPHPLRGPGHRRARRARAGPPLRRGRGRHDLGRRRHPLRRTGRRRAAVVDHGGHLPGRGRARPDRRRRRRDRRRPRRDRRGGPGPDARRRRRAGHARPRRGRPDGLAAGLEAHVASAHLAVDTVVYRGGSRPAPLLIGVE